MSEERIASGQTDAGGDWAERPWILAGLLGLAGLLIWLATDGTNNDSERIAAAAFLFFGSICAAFSLERDRWKEAAAFGLLAGLVMAGLAWRAVGAGDRYADEQYGFAAGVLAAILSLPLFQAGFHRLRFNTPYRDTHFYVWTDAVSAAGSLVFTGLAWLMLFLLAALFQLLKIELLGDLLQKGWFGGILSGAAFGAALGVLRNRIGIIGTLQSVVMLVLSLLAVPLAAGLVLFLLAMIVSGPDVLWEATRSATPVLLACAVGAFILANAIVRDDDTGMTTNPVMRVTSLVLVLSLLPLTAFAAISMGTRIGAYGLSPERLWALVAIAVACAYGLAYLVAVLRGRLQGWRVLLRRANLNLAVGVSVVALLLALPILNFGAVSASNQLARLESGRVSPEDFDYTALRWDFGEAGEKALARLVASDDAEIAGRAADAQKQTERPWYFPGETDDTDERLANLEIRSEDEGSRALIEGFVRAAPGTCMQPCTALDLGAWADGTPHLALVEGTSIYHFRRNAQGSLDYATANEVDHTPAPAPDAATRPEVEVRPYQGRQVFVDGRPVGEPFE